MIESLSVSARLSCRAHLLIPREVSRLTPMEQNYFAGRVYWIIDYGGGAEGPSEARRIFT